MNDWNVVVSVYSGGFVPACRLLQRYGPVKRSDFYNVLVMRVEDLHVFIEALREEVEATPGILNDIARVVPASHTFNFHLAEEFETKAKEVVSGWAPQLGGKGFHVRMHRRGFKGALSSQEEERLLDYYLLEALQAAGRPGHIDFADPDAIIAVETVGLRAGLSFWTREDLKRYPFLNLD